MENCGKKTMIYKMHLRTGNNSRIILQNKGVETKKNVEEIEKETIRTVWREDMKNVERKM